MKRLKEEATQIVMDFGEYMEDINRCIELHPKTKKLPDELIDWFWESLYYDTPNKALVAPAYLAVDEFMKTAKPLLDDSNIDDLEKEGFIVVETSKGFWTVYGD